MAIQDLLSQTGGQLYQANGPSNTKIAGVYVPGQGAGGGMLHNFDANYLKDYGVDINSLPTQEALSQKLGLSTPNGAFYGMGGGQSFFGGNSNDLLNTLGGYAQNATNQANHDKALADSNAKLGANAYGGGSVTPQQQADAAKTQTVNPNPNAIPAQYMAGTPDISQKYQQATQDAQKAGATSPTDATGANTMYSQYLPSQQSDKMGTFVSQDPNLNKIIADYQTQMSSLNNQSSLVDTYKSLLKDSGIPELDTQLLNMNNVMKGTEDDIRNEVTKAGGFASNSQVQALTDARNKQLLKDYNTLQATRDSKQKYLDTMIGLTKDDRTAASQKFDDMMNYGTKIIELNQTMQKNAVDSLNNTAKVIGWDGVYNATQGNPQLVSQIEKAYGMPPGTLATAAQRDKETRELAQQKQLPTSAQEFEYAKANGYKGTYTQYQNDDANRKRSVVINTPVPQVTIAAGQKMLDSSRGNTYTNEKGEQITPTGVDAQYANSKTYLQMLDAWKQDGGLEQKFFTEYPPKSYLNPNDASIPQYIRDKLGKTSSGSTDQTH